MFLLYLDESGPLGDPESAHVVVAGLAVHESLVRRLAREVTAVIARHLDEHLQRVEFHAQHIRQGSKAFHGIPANVRMALLRDMSAVASDFHLAHPQLFAAFAICREPGAIPGAAPVDRIFEEILAKFQAFIRHAGPFRHDLGLVLCDKAKHEAVIQPRVGDWLSNGFRLGRLSRIADVPYFADSRASRLIQLADLVAHAVWRAYEKNDADLLDLLLPAFSRGQEQRLDTFSHLTGRRAVCDCHPCSSRRPQQPEAVAIPVTSGYEQPQLFPVGN